jgi:hypothetical protein
MSAQATTDLIINELRALPTQERLRGLYGLGIGGCESGNREQVRAVLLELIDSLDHSYADVAEAFHQLYAYCLNQCSQGSLEHVSFVFEDLWATLLRASGEVASA